MRRIQAPTFRAIVGLLLCAASFAACPCLAVYHPMDGEIVLAQSGEMSSTADEAQQRWIRQLAQSGREGRDLAPVTVDYPLDASVFPPEIIAPTFLWHDAAGTADRWLVDLAYGDGPIHLYVLVPGLPPSQGEIDPMALSSTNEVYQPTAYQASARSWKPSVELWQVIKDRSAEAPVTVTVYGFSGDAQPRALSRGSTTLTTSLDPVGAPIFYRDVPLMPPPKGDKTIMPLRKGALPLIQWRLRDISLPASRVMLKDMPTCANCHSFSADGATMGMDIDGPRGDKGAYAIAATSRNMIIDSDDVITWNSFEDKPSGHKTLGFMSRMSPDGRHSVTTLNEQIYVANFQDYKFGQVFYPTRGILAYYSQDTGEMKALPGADDPDYVHINPVWTPDGKTILFARGRATDAFPEGRPFATYAGDPNETPMQYDLYRIPFNDGRGGTPEPIAGASANGMSNSFPKVSPDGKWIVYVQCKNGQLMRPDSKLWIVPIEGGESRLMRCNTSLMNSWHSFSPNGRWMIFSSKSNTPYTQMFLTHIDEEGRDTPAVLVENSTAANRAVNLPEFINRPYDEFAGIRVEAVEHYRHYDRGQELAGKGKVREAVAEFEKALAVESQESRIHISLSKALIELGEYERAMEPTRQALEINPFNFEMHTNYAFLMARKGDVETALGHLSAATRINPIHPQAWYNRATLYLQQQEYEKALADYDEALRVHPRYPDALNGRGMVRRTLGLRGEALEDFDSSIRLRQTDPTPWYFKALTLTEMGDLSSALESLDRALGVLPPRAPRVAQIRALRDQVLASLDQAGAGKR